LDVTGININLDDLLFVLTLIFGLTCIISLVALRKREEAIPSQETATVSAKEEKKSLTYHVRKTETSSRKAERGGAALKNKSNAKPHKRREQRT